MAFLRRIWNKWQNLLHDEKLKHKIYVIIFESDTPMGKLFDVALDRKSTRLNSSHEIPSRMPSSA